MNKTILFIILTCIFNVPGQNKEQESLTYNPPKSYIAYKTFLPLTIDGKADEAAWQNVEWTDYFVDIEGNKKPEPYFKTRVKILWDYNYFYFYAEMEEPHVWGNITQRDAVIFHNNDFEIFIKPYTEFPQYGELEINSLGTVWDLLLINAYRENGPVINNWDIKGLKSAVNINGTINNPTDIDEGWSVEIAIPIEALRELTYWNDVNKIPETWRINFSRVEWNFQIENGKYIRKKDKSGNTEPEHNWVWSPQGVIDMHQPDMWGYVKFSKEKPGTDKFVPGSNEEIIQALLHLYKLQKKYFKENKKYAKNVSEIESLKFLFNNIEYVPVTALTNFGFEIVFDLTEQKMKIAINEKGIIHKTGY